MIYIKEKQEKPVTFHTVTELAKSLLNGDKYIYDAGILSSIDDPEMLFEYNFDHLNDLSPFIKVPLSRIKRVPWYKHADFTSRMVPVFIHIEVDGNKFITEVDYYKQSTDTLVDMNGREFPVDSEVVIFDVGDMEKMKNFFTGYKDV